MGLWHVRIIHQGLTRSSVVENVPDMCKALCFLQYWRKRKERKEKGGGRDRAKKKSLWNKGSSFLWLSSCAAMRILLLLVSASPHIKYEKLLKDKMSSRVKYTSRQRVITLFNAQVIEMIHRLMWKKLSRAKLSWLIKDLEYLCRQDYSEQTNLKLY